MPESLDLYVSPAGDNAGSGRDPDPTGDGSDGPIAGRVRLVKPDDLVATKKKAA